MNLKMIGKVGAIVAGTLMGLSFYSQAFAGELTVYSALEEDDIADYYQRVIWLPES